MPFPLAGAAALLLLTSAVHGRELAQRHSAIHKHAPRLPASAASLAPPAARDTPGVKNCTLSYFTQRIDHFSFAATPTGAETYQQRYFTYDKYWDKENGAIFFYK